MTEPPVYAEGKVAKLWEVTFTRSEEHKNFLINLLRQNKCKSILDVACGTGSDSIILVEEGFDVVSVDISASMLKYALKERWERRKESNFDKWVIEEANWLTLPENLKLSGISELKSKEEAADATRQFDAVLCIGNSFSHLLNPSDQMLALRNFTKFIKPGGILLIDHRNYDLNLQVGQRPHNEPFHSPWKSEKCSVDSTDISIVYKNGHPTQIIFDCVVDVKPFGPKYADVRDENGKCPVQYIHYPHRLELFKRFLLEAFDNKCQITSYGDYKLFDCPKQKDDEDKSPFHYLHVVYKLK